MTVPSTARRSHRARNGLVVAVHAERCPGDERVLGVAGKSPGVTHHGVVREVPAGETGNLAVVQFRGQPARSFRGNADRCAADAVVDVVVQEENFALAVQPLHQESQVALDAEVGSAVPAGDPEPQGGRPDRKPGVPVSMRDVDDQRPTVWYADQPCGCFRLERLEAAQRDQRNTEPGRQVCRPVERSGSP